MVKLDLSSFTQEIKDADRYSTEDRCPYIPQDIFLFTLAQEVCDTHILGTRRRRYNDIYEVDMSCKLRIIKEVQEAFFVPGASESNFRLLKNELGDAYQWRVLMKGPSGTPYKDGLFALKVLFS